MQIALALDDALLHELAPGPRLRLAVLGVELVQIRDEARGHGGREVGVARGDAQVHEEGLDVHAGRHAAPQLAHAPVQAVGRALRSPDPSPDPEDGEQGDRVARRGAPGIGKLREQHARQQLPARQHLGVEAGRLRRVHAEGDAQLAREPHQPAATGARGPTSPARGPLLGHEGDRRRVARRQEQHHDRGQDRGEEGQADHQAPALEQGVDEVERAAVLHARRPSLIRKPRKLDRDGVRRWLGHY